MEFRVCTLATIFVSSEISRFGAPRGLGDANVSLLYNVYTDIALTHAQLSHSKDTQKLVHQVLRIYCLRSNIRLPESVRLH